MNISPAQPDSPAKSRRLRPESLGDCNTAGPPVKEANVNILPLDRKIQVLNALVEGNSIRSIERMTGTNRNTTIGKLKISGRSNCVRAISEGGLELADSLLLFQAINNCEFLVNFDIQFNEPINSQYD